MANEPKPAQVTHTNCGCDGCLRAIVIATEAILTMYPTPTAYVN